MDLKQRTCLESWTNSSLENNSSRNHTTSYQQFTQSNLQNHPKWNEPSDLDYGISIELPFPELNPLSEPSFPCEPNNQIKLPHQVDVLMNEALRKAKVQNWDSRAMLSNLSFLEEKIHQLQDLVHLIVAREGRVLGQPDELLAQQQQLVTADLTSIIVQLISTAGSLIPSVKHTLTDANPIFGQLGQLSTMSGILSPLSSGMNGVLQQNNSGSKVSNISIPFEPPNNCGPKQNLAGQSNPCSSPLDEHESKDDEDIGEGENLPPGSYEVLQLEKEEILAPHTHFCMICGKGFKRDANLRMHMRGHGDEYKTPAALAKPHKESSCEPIPIKRYSCPFEGCKRNKDHKKFQPLKTILCVKNHYKRTHCDKSYICSRCHTKKFSVIADLKTHEKHCGRDKWLCSCGTTFSRKDKLFGHVALFQGHTPALTLDETKGSSAPSELGESSEAVLETSARGTTGFNLKSNTSGESGTQNVSEFKDVDDPASLFSPLNNNICHFGRFHEFPRPPFEASESSFTFAINGSCNYIQKSGGALVSDNL